MTISARAIYEKGYLRLLDEVDLVEGEPVDVQIQKKDDEASFREALKDMDIQWADPTADPNPEVEAMAEEIFNSLRGIAPLSDLIIEERGEF